MDNELKPLGDDAEKMADGYYRRGPWEAEVYDGPDGLVWIHLREIDLGIVYEGPCDKVLVNYIIEELTR